MKKDKKKIFIALGAVCLFFIVGIVFALNHMYDADHAISTSDPLYDKSQLMPPYTEQGTEQINKNDPECDGEKDQYYDIGFGVEHVYTGSITTDMPIKMILSCDHERLTIRGSVNQVIEGKDITNSDTAEIADTSNGSLIIYLEDDKNKDGYNDLETVLANGSQVDTYATFLYSPIKKKFVFSKTYEVDNQEN